MREVRTWDREHETFTHATHNISKEHYIEESQALHQEPMVRSLSLISEYRDQPNTHTPHTPLLPTELHRLTPGHTLSRTARHIISAIAALFEKSLYTNTDTETGRFIIHDNIEMKHIERHVLHHLRDAHSIERPIVVFSITREMGFGQQSRARRQTLQTFI